LRADQPIITQIGRRWLCVVCSLFWIYNQSKEHRSARIVTAIAVAILVDAGQLSCDGDPGQS